MTREFIIYERVTCPNPSCEGGIAHAYRSVPDRDSFARHELIECECERCHGEGTILVEVPLTVVLRELGFLKMLGIEAQ